MPITTFRGETSVEALADKVYADLDEPARRKAVRALIRANPTLENIEEVKRGAVLRVPELAGARRTAARHGENPGEDLARDLADRLEAYARSLGERFDIHQEELARQARLLETDQLGSVLANVPEARALAEEAKEAVAGEAEEAKDTRARLEKAVEKLGKDLRDR